jgi:hypothetical protein
MSNTADAKLIKYYKKIYQTTKRKIPGGLVVGNPGTSTEEIYLTKPTADMLVVSEIPAKDGIVAPKDWYQKYDAENFAHLILGEPNESNLESIINTCSEANVGVFYITDDILPNPWDRLPTYFQSLVDILN